jgi:hypothetical protein
MCCVCPTACRNMPNCPAGTVFSRKSVLDFTFRMNPSLPVSVGVVLPAAGGLENLRGRCYSHHWCVCACEDLVRVRVVALYSPSDASDQKLARWLDPRLWSCGRFNRTSDTAFDWRAREASILMIMMSVCVDARARALLFCVY